MWAFALLAASVCPADTLCTTGSYRGAGSITYHRDYCNAATVDIYGGGSFRVASPGTVYSQIAGGSTVVNGMLIAPTIDIQGGMLSGSGTIQGNVLLDGTLSPGNSPGTLTVFGDYTQESRGVLAMEIGSATVGGWDVLNVNGNVTLDNLLEIQLLGYTGHFGDAFPILMWTGSLTLEPGFQLSVPSLGNGLHFHALWGDTSLTMQVLDEDNGLVPEPCAFQMLLIGLAILLRRRT